MAGICAEFKRRVHAAVAFPGGRRWPRLRIGDDVVLRAEALALRDRRAAVQAQIGRFEAENKKQRFGVRIKIRVKGLRYLSLEFYLYLSTEILPRLFPALRA